MKDLRDYGLGETKPTGVPTWTPIEHTCPNCKAQLCEVQVRTENPLLRGGKGLCTYMGCPACPYASPAMSVADRA